VRKVDEALDKNKTSPAVDPGEKFGNSDARQLTVEALGGVIDMRFFLPDRADRQPRIADQRFGKLISQHPKRKSLQCRNRRRL
jgi:hypothetical protein